MAKRRDYYEVLGISKSASQDEIRKAHRKLVRQYHPDANRDNPAAAEKFKEVQEAYDVLSDTEKRKQYDQLGHAAFDPHMGAQGAGGAAYDPYDAFRRASSGRNYRPWRGGDQNVTVEDFEAEGGGGINDIFEQFFGRSARRGRPAATPADTRGKDVEQSVTISFKDAARGVTMPIRLMREGGKSETIDLKIPAGVKNGSRVRLRGKGETGPGQAGDLYIGIKVSDHPYFRREDLDIYVDLPISYYEAIMGTKVDVPTLDGNVTLTVPQGTSSGAKLRIRGKGIRRGDDHGDQFAVIKVMVPKEFNEEVRSMVEKLAQKQPFDPRANLRW